MHMDKNMEDYKVIVIIATHKEYQFPNDQMYLPVYVGAAGKKIKGYQSDDDGENISYLNPYFCELTGAYWAWKNLKADYLGLVHYRRYFCVKYHPHDVWNSILKYEDIKNDLGRIKVFIPKKRRYWIETLYSHYAHTHYILQLDETRRIIEEKYPEYIKSFDKVCKQRWGYMFNMIIIERKLYSEYCSWLFDILFELRTRLGEEGLTPFHQRYYGRISEIIFNVWLTEQINIGEIKKAEIKEMPIVHIEKVDWLKKGIAFMKAKFLGVRYE